MHEIISIAKKAIRIMLGSESNPELILISSPGSSGSRVFIFKDLITNYLYAVKCSQGTRISLLEEVSRRETLVPYLQDYLPEILSCQIVDGFEVMISECNGIKTLHDLIINNELSHNDLLNIWKDVVNKFAYMWKNSQHKFKPELCPRYFPSRIKRISDGLSRNIINGVSLSKCWRMPVVINDQEYQSISDSIDIITNVGIPKMGVICHGDPHPSNIIVRDGGSWYCVDWEWSGPNQDWRMMMSHLYGWWSTRCVSFVTKPNIEVSGGYLKITYQDVIPEYIKLYQGVSNSAAILISDGNISQQDSVDINKFLSALYFGELRFLKLWNREEFSPMILAQAIITSNELGKNSFKQFQFNHLKKGK